MGGVPETVLETVMETCYLPGLKAHQQKMAVHNSKHGLVDHTGQFSNIMMEWSGKMCDPRILSSSMFYAMKKGSFDPKTTVDINNVMIRYIILGDPAYPLLLLPRKSFTGYLDGRKELFKYKSESLQND